MAVNSGLGDMKRKENSCFLEEEEEKEEKDEKREGKKGSKMTV